MSDSDGIFLSAAVLCLAVAVLGLARRVRDLEEDIDLDKIPAANLESLLEAKRAIEKRAVARAAERLEA